MSAGNRFVIEQIRCRSPAPGAKDTLRRNLVAAIGGKAKVRKANDGFQVLGSLCLRAGLFRPCNGRLRHHMGVPFGIGKPRLC